MSPDFEPGDVVGERYRLDRLIGEGGMGVVWAATHTITNKRIAIKILKAQGDEVRHRFIREARVASAIRHPNIIDIHDVVELDDGQPAMVMDLLEGEVLSERLDRVGSLDLTELANILLPVLSAVGTAHARGVVHRDLKPENIFLCGASAKVAPTDVRVLDFGIAKLTETQRDIAHTGSLTQTGSVLGTPTYMAPEQVYGEKSIDHRADIWTLGIIIHECLRGTCPIDGENVGQIFKSITQHRIPPLSKLKPDLPTSFTSIVDRMLIRDPEERLPSVLPIAEALANATGHPVPSIEMVAPSKRAPKQREYTPEPMATTIAAPALKLARLQKRIRLGVAAILTVAVGALAFAYGGDEPATADPVVAQRTDPTPTEAPLASSEPPPPEVRAAKSAPIAPTPEKSSAPKVNVVRPATNKEAPPVLSSAPAPASSVTGDTEAPGGLYEQSPY